jgi:hypothetical protein
MRTIAVTKHEGIVDLLQEKGYLSGDAEVLKTQVFENWGKLNKEDWNGAIVCTDVQPPYWVAADCHYVVFVDLNIPQEHRQAPNVTPKRARDWLHDIVRYDVRRA